VLCFCNIAETFLCYQGSKGKTGLKWEEERRKFFEDRGWEIGEMERKREEGEAWLVS